MIVDFKLVTVKQKYLEFSENLGVLISEYVARLQKIPVLVTLRDVATLTNVTSSAENTARIPYKKRKI
ncbi:hypothetical protein GCK72_021569 [Caenorhabditis remanei]|uniref:Uncharacterized protein n=1 Tax=Caenorhabditis remanei TaxID=31234 RepID=A0A6A5GKG3_CAERE|nr:hypothetical protein GCK72_021569 [Caenorhabditis remanei]KAF1755002.1 hypothetical protein GCK72_021569 [Caenorhabditis remanei]